ncbi:unnamed protein product [Urochloa decumbens]|uniref:Uncharacterized protein n=1 Tax=Urochloa decumbens TaxID=240449 RepID=A0ABC9FF38_9POAL
MAGLKALCACILIFLIVASDAASGEARRLQAVTSTGEEEGAGLPSSPGGERPMSRPRGGDDDHRRHGHPPTTPGHSPGIGNKIITGN